MKQTDHTTRLETLLMNLPGMAYRCLNESHWPMDFVSQGCFDLCGYHRREIESQSTLWGDFTHPEDIDNVDRLVRCASGLGESFEVEYRIITKCGDVKWVWERGRVVHMRDDGVAVLEGFITDITTRKQSETKLQHAQAYAQAVVNSAAEAVITIDGQGQIESFNRAASRMFNYNTSEAAERFCRQLIATSDRPVFDAYFEQHKNADITVQTGSDIKGLRQSGGEFPITLFINKVDAALDSRYVILIRDLTRQQARDLQLREQRELLAHVDRLNTLGEMAAAIAHEINQPLTAISTHAQSGLRFLHKTPPTLSRLEEGLELISAQARRAGLVIERIQMMARRQERLPEVVNVGTLIKGIYHLAKLEAHTRNFTIELDLCNELPTVLCDSVQIQQVVLNLLRNGMESMSAAACQINSVIQLQCMSVEGGVRIAIVDSGAGVSDQAAAQLFEPFRSSKQLGMGLGLAISRSIIVAHESSLEYFDNPGGGATFRFTLASASEPKQPWVQE
jgi:two-component system sensor kinase FixL